MKVGRYSIIEKIGDGPFSSVYQAKDTAFKDRIVAIKIWHAPLKYRNIYDSFLQDVQSLIALRHTHILPVLEVNVDGDTL